jgi:hypothetical protein
VERELPANLGLMTDDSRQCVACGTCADADWPRVIGLGRQLNAPWRWQGFRVREGTST